MNIVNKMDMLLVDETSVVRGQLEKEIKRYEGKNSAEVVKKHRKKMDNLLAKIKKSGNEKEFLKIVNKQMGTSYTSFKQITKLKNINEEAVTINVSTDDYNIHPDGTVSKKDKRNVVYKTAAYGFHISRALLRDTVSILTIALFTLPTLVLMGIPFLIANAIGFLVLSVLIYLNHRRYK